MIEILTSCCCAVAACFNLACAAFRALKDKNKYLFTKKTSFVKIKYNNKLTLRDLEFVFPLNFVLLVSFVQV